jgi:hypothetical protein
MGNSCCDSKEEKQTQVLCKTRFSLAEESFKFASIDSRHLDNTIHRYSYSEFIPKSNLVKALYNLEITEIDPLQFKGFVVKTPFSAKEECYSTKKICTMAVILGQGTKGNKLQMLFSSYDINLSRVLSKDELKALIEDITEIFLEIIPEVAAEKHPSEIELRTTAENFKFVRESIVVYFLYEILAEFTDIDWNDFVDQFEKPDIAVLLNPEALRQFASVVYNKTIAEKKTGEKKNIRKNNNTIHEVNSSIE